MRVIRKIWHGIIFIFTNVLFFVSFPLAFIIYGGKKIWLISEVDFDARDNGFHLFTFLRIAAIGSPSMMPAMMIVVSMFKAKSMGRIACNMCRLSLT